MVALEIMHFYIMQFMFEDTSILHYMYNEQFDYHVKNCPGKQGRLTKHPCYWDNRGLC